MPFKEDKYTVTVPTGEPDFFSTLLLNVESYIPHYVIVGINKGEPVTYNMSHGIERVNSLQQTVT